MKTSEPFHNMREKPMLKNKEWPAILKDEVRSALKLKLIKAGPDEIVAEMLSALGNFGIDKITEVIHKIDNSGDILEDFTKYIFVILPKRPGENKCKHHQTISLTRHVTKLMMRILMNRSQSRMRPEIEQEQDDFVKDTGTRNVIFMIKMISEMEGCAHVL